MEIKQIALTCPNCGNSETSLELNIHFGYEYKCKYCGSTSVLVINNRLYMPLPGERICPHCGRVAERSARYCQCGKPLIHKCIFPDCLKEFPVDHSICDYCGWPQNIDPYSQDGQKRRLELSIHEMGDPDPKTAAAGYKFARKALIGCQDLELLEIALNQLGNAGGKAYSLLAEIVLHSPQPEYRIKAWRVLSKQIELYRDQTGFSETLCDIFVSSKDDSIRNDVTNAIINVGSDAVRPLVNKMEDYAVYSIREQAVNMFIKIGKPAINHLKKSIYDPEISDPVKDWISTAILTIQNSR